MLWLLVLLSVAALAVILERAVLFVTSRDDATRLRFDLALLGALAKHAPLGV